LSPDATAPLYQPNLVSVGIDELRQAGQDTLQAGVVGVVLPAAGLASLILAIGWTAGFAIVLLRESGNPLTNGKALAPSTAAYLL
jgi:hypothetical protein